MEACIRVFITSKKNISNYFHERSNRGQSLRFLLFLSSYFIGRYILFFIESTSSGRALLNPIFDFIFFYITHSCCFFLHFFYPTIYTSANHVIIINDIPRVQMLPGCTGFYHMFRLSFALLFYPVAWQKKWLILLPTLFIIIFASTLHFLLLILIEYHHPELFRFAHDYITKILFFGFIFFCWLIWEKLTPNLQKNVN